MPARFNALRNRVRDWSNRDIEALPDAIIEDSMRWAADKAYRVLRVPPIEFIATYTAEELRTEEGSNLFQSASRMTLPSNLIEFIQIRAIDGQRRTARVFNEKADIRTFRDMYGEKYNDFAFWTREGNDVLLAPALGTTGGTFGSTGVGEETGVELYYYGRLPGLDAQYDVNVANWQAGNLRMATAEGPALPIPPAQMTGETDAAYQARLVTALAAITDAVGAELDHWLRDDNQRVIIYGALSECFAYLQEEDQQQKYATMFASEIAALNDEDVRRNASGGNVQVNFNGRGLI